MKRYFRASALLALLLVGLGVIGGGLGASALGVTSDTALYQPGSIQRNVGYCPCQPDLAMDIYFPGIANASLPAIIYVHGGGWYSGDKQDPANQVYIKPLVAAGYIVAAVNYRLAPRFQFPAQIDDVKCAVRFLKENAEKYNINAGKIGVIGDSAGGHLAALLGLTGDHDYPCELSDCVQAVVDLYGPTDLTVSFKNESLLLLDHVFGTDDRSSEILKEASPLTFVSSNAPPFLIIHGEKDDTVIPEQSEALYKQLCSAGAPASLIMVQNANHALVSDGNPISPGRNQINASIVSFFNENLRE